MSQLNKLGLIFILLGISAFDNGGWSGAFGVFFVVLGSLTFLWPSESAPNKGLQVDVANVFCKCDNPQFDLLEQCRECGKPPRH